MSDKCSSCELDCEDKSNCEKEYDFRAKLNEKSNVSKVIGVVSGKGGVGKSLVTSLLATYMKKEGYEVGILDGDITGPSIPRVFGITEKAYADEDGAMPAVTKSGIKLMSSNMILENETDPVVWRGPVIANMVKQFWTDVNWGSIDYMFVDMPPGTGDVPLTVFQSLPIDGIVVVTSPQDLVSMIVGKSINMAKLMNIPILGVVENMSYAECPDCKKKIEIFGESKLEEVLEEYDISVSSRIPINPKILSLIDSNSFEDIEEKYLEEIINQIYTV